VINSKHSSRFSLASLSLSLLFCICFFFCRRSRKKKKTFRSTKKWIEKSPKNVKEELKKTKKKKF